MRHEAAIPNHSQKLVRSSRSQETAKQRGRFPRKNLKAVKENLERRKTQAQVKLS